MPRPSFITDEEVAALDAKLDSDIANTVFDVKSAKEGPIREVFRAGLWLTEELHKLDCDETLMVRFQYTFGKESFGKDPWTMATDLLDAYLTNTYTLAEDEYV